MDGLGIHDLALFTLTVFVLNATPGVDMLYTVGRTLTGGWRAGLAATLGVCSGCVVHTLAAAFGLAALMAVSAWAFSLVKWAGAAYLVWLGLGMLRDALRSTAAAPASAPPLARASWSQVYRQGVLTNVLNPKVALFFLAFLPQFIVPDAEHKTLAFLALGTWSIVQGMLFLVVLVALTASLRRLGGSPRLARALNAAGGLLFVGLAARLAQAEVQA
ncbi:LysE family translocator [Ideonella sp.]|uniref:LysE family translocator n=1 Tax=Ideonella sp. TaxID=1929293 RepID=UPI002B45C3F2|nr:LysE family translocator [Ideonella sp.]HJV69851.1 LysE family translocator [Ideonella sp.]